MSKCYFTFLSKQPNTGCHPHFFYPWWPRLTPLVAKLLFINTPAVRTTKERPKSIAAYKTTQSTCKNNQRNTANTLTTQNRSIFQANHNITTQNNLNHNTTDSNTTRPINTQTQPNHSNITIPEPKPKRKPSKYISESLNSRSKAVVYFFRKFEVENGISRLKHIGKNKKKKLKKKTFEAAAAPSRTAGHRAAAATTTALPSEKKKTRGERRERFCSQEEGRERKTREK